MKMNNKTKKAVFIVTITLVLLALIGLMIYYYSDGGDCGNEYRKQENCPSDKCFMDWFDDDYGKFKCYDKYTAPCKVYWFNEELCNAQKKEDGISARCVLDKKNGGTYCNPTTDPTVATPTTTP